MPTSKETRVRVEGCSKINATDLPASESAPAAGPTCLELVGPIEQSTELAGELLARDEVGESEFPVPWKRGTLLLRGRPGRRIGRVRAGCRRRRSDTSPGWTCESSPGTSSTVATILRKPTC